MAKRGDYQTFQNAGKDVFRVTGQGGVVVSTGGIVQPEAGLFIRHESVILTPSSSSFFINPPITIATQGVINGATTYVDGAIFTTVSTAPSFTNSSPLYPRTLEFYSNNATGSVVFVGTDCYNRSGTRETIIYGSNSIYQSQTCWVGLSSMTINFTIPTTNLNPSSSTFFVGTSSGYLLPFRVDFPTDVFRVTWGQVQSSTGSQIQPSGTNFVPILYNQSIITTATINTANNTIQVSSMAFPQTLTPVGNNSGLSTSTLFMNVWGIERRSVYAPTVPSP